MGHRVTTMGDESVLILERADGSTTRFVVRDGAVTLDGAAIATAPPTDFRRAWDATLRDAWELDPAQLLARLTELPDAPAALQDRLRQLAAGTPAATAAVAPVAPAAPVPPAAPVAPTPPRSVLRTAERMGIDLHGLVRTGDFTVKPGQTVEGDLVVLNGDVNVFGFVDGDLTVLSGDVVLHRQGEVDGDVVLHGGRVIDDGGHIRGEVTRLDDGNPVRRSVSNSLTGKGPSFATLIAFFVAMAGMGFGLTFYLPKQLDVLTDTVRGSFGKSFLAGLFTQPLLVPAFAIGILGLAITVVGILLIPLAVPALILALMAVATAGYLAVARAVGDHYVNRRLARGIPTRVTPYRSLLYGLVALLAVWLPSIFLGWIPFVGQVATVAALLFTWVMATAGLGAAVLSRAGLRATFRKPGAAYLTDEHFWLPPAGGRP